MNKLVPLGILLLCGCNNHLPQQFSKDGKVCAIVRYNPSIDEWNVFNNVDTAIFPTEKAAIAFARSMCQIVKD